MTRLTQVPDDAAPGSSWFRTLASKEDYARAEALDRLCERLYGKSLQVFGETMSGEYTPSGSEAVGRRSTYSTLPFLYAPTSTLEQYGEGDGSCCSSG